MCAGLTMNSREIGILIRQARMARRLTQAELAAAIGVTHTTINRLEGGTQNIALFKLLKISEILKVPIHALFTKEALVPKLESEKEPTIVEIFPDQETKLEFDRLQTRDDFVAIRIVGSASLGPGLAISSEETKGYALVYKHAIPRKARKQTRKQEKIVCVFAEGTSMLPTIQDRSLVAIDVEDRDEITNNKIYAVALPDAGGDKISIKRVSKSGDFLMLLADNQNEPGFPMFINRREISYNPICGRVVWAWNKF